MQKGTTFTIAADKDASVKEVIEGLKEWRAFKLEDGTITDREIAEGVHTMNKTKQAFRLIGLKWQNALWEYHDRGQKQYITKTIQTIQWWLTEIAEKVVRHGRILWLLLATTVDKYRIYLKMRKRCMAFG